jgi:hypothetical protein
LEPGDHFIGSRGGGGRGGGGGGGGGGERRRRRLKLWVNWTQLVQPHPGVGARRTRDEDRLFDADKLRQRLLDAPLHRG